MARHEAIFVSSPVDGIKEYRDSVRKALISLSGRFANKKFLFYMYELHLADQMLGAHQNYAELIVGHCDEEWVDTPCTLFLLFFANRIGNGTRSEFELFRERFRQAPNTVQLWWKKIDNGEADDADVQPFLEGLYEYGEQIPDDIQYDHNSSIEFGPFIMSALHKRAFSK